MELDRPVMTVADVAAYLQLSEKTVLKMIKNNEIPCAKIANQWRFMRDILEDWITAKMEVIPQNDLSRLIEQQYDYVPLSRLIHEDSIILDLKSDTRNGVLEEMAQKAFQCRLVSDAHAFYEKLLERENLTSTAVGNGIAIPHLRTPSDQVVKEARILIGISKKGVDFNAIDGKRSFLFFLLISDSETVHLKLMSKLAYLLRDESNVSKLRAFNNKKDLISFFIQYENTTFFGGEKA